MDRSIVYPGSIPLDTDLLNTNRNMMIGLGALMQAVLGSATVVARLRAAGAFILRTRARWAEWAAIYATIMDGSSIDARR